MLSALICQAKVKGAGHSPWACQPRTFPLLSECLGRFPHKAVTTLLSVSVKPEQKFQKQLRL